MADIENLNVRRAEMLKDNSLVTPLDNLEDVAREVRNGTVWADGGKPTKAIILLLDDADGKYQTRRYISDMKCSEQLALLDVIMADIRRQMGY
jgi:hypothetical protein